MSPGHNSFASRTFARTQNGLGRAGQPGIARAGFGPQHRAARGPVSRFAVAPGADGVGHDITLAAGEAATITFGPDGAVAIAVSGPAAEVAPAAEPAPVASEVEKRRGFGFAGRSFGPGIRRRLGRQERGALARAYAVSGDDGSVTIYPEPGETLATDAADPLAITVTAEPF